MAKERSAAVQVAEALKIPVQTLYSRFYQAGLKTTGLTVAEILRLCGDWKLKGIAAATRRLNPREKASGVKHRARPGKGNGHAAAEGPVDWENRSLRAMRILTPLDLEARERIAAREELPGDWKLCEAYSILSMRQTAESQTEAPDE
jgi:hypothetical protein